MKSLLRSLARTAAFRPLAVWVEDTCEWRRHAGTPERLNALRQTLASLNQPEQLIEFSRQFFPPCQIPSEIFGLLRLLARENVRRAGEIGTAQGGTHFLFQHSLPNLEFTLAVDLQIRHVSLLRGLAPIGAELLAVNGSSYAPRTVAKVRHILNGRLLDFLLIDGDHRYEGVRADYLAYLDMVRPGGLIAFHDIKPAGEDAQGVVSERWAGGVPRFWQELKAQHQETWEFVDDPHQAGFGIGVLRKPLAG